MENEEIFNLNNDHEGKHLKNIRRNYPEILATEYSESRLKGENYHISFATFKDYLEEIPKYIHNKNVENKNFTENNTICIVFKDGHIERVSPMSIIDDLPPKNGQSMLSVIKNQERLNEVSYAFKATEMDWGEKHTKKLTIFVKREPMPRIVKKIEIVRRKIESE